jgi:hypothetical protein
MSTTMSMTTIPPSDPLSWKQADVDVHVATRDGEFAGFVEFDGSIHLVRDQHGTHLGSFPTLDDARLALEAAHEPAVRTSGFPLSLPRALRRRPRRVRA